MSLTTPKSKKAKISYIIEKITPEYQIFYYDKIGVDSYKVADDRQLQWHILPEKEKIGEWETQKASLHFGGRQWTAWFSTEIPIPDGPYKFHSLPGIIVKIEDAKKDFSFELKGINPRLASVPDLLSKSYVSVSQAQFKKLFLENREDPTKSFRNLMNASAGSQITLITKDGQSLSAKELMRQQTAKIKQNLKNKNIYIEQDWLEK
ncbi:GLPGLI family protein [Riemerella columbina]|nr:GLPGLI family protein [Riemerella columbina]WKS96099.1 GLPGLI family protein [Riemerella columbina]